MRDITSLVILVITKMVITLVIMRNLGVFLCLKITGFQSRCVLSIELYLFLDLDFFLGLWKDLYI